MHLKLLKVEKQEEERMSERERERDAIVMAVLT